MHGQGYSLSPLPSTAGSGQMGPLSTRNGPVLLRSSTFDFTRLNTMEVNRPRYSADQEPAALCLPVCTAVLLGQAELPTCRHSSDRLYQVPASSLGTSALLIVC